MRPLPPVSSAGLVVHIQCYGDHSYARDEDDDDEDGRGADSFMQSCVHTEDRLRTESHSTSSHQASPGASLFPPCLCEHPKSLKCLSPRGLAAGAAGTLDDNSNVFADRA